MVEPEVSGWTQALGPHRLRIVCEPGYLDLNHMLMEALGGMRGHLSLLTPEERPAWNRMLLFIWPPLDLAPDELSDIIHHLAPLTEGLGIEQVVMRAQLPQRDGKGCADSVAAAGRIG